MYSGSKEHASVEQGVAMEFFYLILLLGLVLGISILLYQLIQLRKKSLVILQEKNAHEQKLQEEQSRFDTLFVDTHIGMAILDLKGQFLRVNQPVKNLFGFTEEELLNLNYFDLISKNSAPDLNMHLSKLIAKQLKTYHTELKCLTKSGRSLWVMTTFTLIKNHNDQPKYFIMQIHDITLQKKAEEKLRHMAFHDTVTGLANRNAFEKFVTHNLVAARRHSQGFALLFLDLDRFKTINDTIGHEAGDTLLQIIAERLRNTVRDTDLVARLGGDEFIIVVTDIARSESAAVVAQKILDSVQRPIILKGQEIYITTSVGISLFPHDGQNIQTLMKNADLSLYRAKEHGRNNYEFYTLEMTSKAQEKLALQNTLGQALSKNEFTLHYQAKMNFKSRHITGVEAFLRWNNDQYGRVPIDEIINLAEETGLIIPLSQWINEAACKQLQKWHELGHSNLTISVNCSSRQLKHPAFLKELIEALEKSKIAPKFFEIEIKESAIMQDTEMALQMLYRLKEAGINIAIDDFGTGYWSLNNLKRLSVDRIKIDKSFIKNLTLDESSATITKAMIAMANKLKIVSVAEGVETKAQYEFLEREGCTEIQGYYLSKPLPADAMTKFLCEPSSVV